MYTALRSLLLATVVACGSSKPTSESPKPPVADLDPSCPVAVPGTSVTVEDADDGAALVFVTTGDVTELRKRVSAMATMHNEHHSAMGPLPDGKSGGHEGHDMSGHAGHDMSGHGSADTSKHAGHAGGMIGIHSKAAASDIDKGAKLSFVAGGADVGKLQSELRVHAQHLGTGSCAMGKS